jgi:hypothetical protein
MFNIFLNESVGLFSAWSLKELVGFIDAFMPNDLSPRS